MCKDRCKNKLCVDWEAIAHNKRTFLITTDEVVDSEGDELSSEECEPSSTEDSEEEETDPRVREKVGEIVI